MKENTDQEIIQRVIAGERKAYAELINRHKDKAMTLAVRMLKNHQEAEEALQDAFIRAFRALPGFEWKSSFSTWFYRIVFNVCSSMLSKRGDKAMVSLDEENDEQLSLQLSAMDDEPDVVIEQKELTEIIKEEIAAMEAKYSAILTMFFLQEMSYEEIMEVTGLPLGTVKNRLFRARSALRNAVQRRISEMTLTEKI